jgi:hypothetical protein
VYGVSESTALRIDKETGEIKPERSKTSLATVASEKPNKTLPVAVESQKPDKTIHSQIDDANKCTQPNTYRDVQETTREREGEIDSRLFDLENGGVYRLVPKPKRNNRAVVDSWVKGQLKRYG